MRGNKPSPEASQATTRRGFTISANLTTENVNLLPGLDQPSQQVFFLLGSQTFISKTFLSHMLSLKGPSKIE